MRWLVTCSILALSVAASSAGAQDAPNRDLFERPEAVPLAEQDRNSFQDFVDALGRAAIKPADFVFSPTKIEMDLTTGESGSQIIRLTNQGGKSGDIRGINLIGAFDGLVLAEDCPEELASGATCDITISYSSERARSIETAIVGTVSDADQINFNIPVVIEVNDLPVAVEPEVDPNIPTYLPAPGPQGPTSQDIAAAYFGALGMPGGFAPITPGISVISAPASTEVREFAGVPFDDMRVQTIIRQDRYDRDAVASTEASLPVNRDLILTSDRVIKAVLETPVSNVMCSKTVATVESDVYSATSRKPLIPAGSRVIGSCQTFVDERVGIAWERIITTDGRSISFQDKTADTRDAMGLGGALGRVYRSPFDRYVLPIFSSMIDTAAGVIFATFGEDEKVTTDANGNIIQEVNAKNEGIRIVTNGVQGTTNQIIQDIQDVREIAVVPAGSRIDIEIQEDIYFVTEKKVVLLADMQFDLNDIEIGEASRDLPQNIKLVPAEAGYEGATMLINGRRYMIEDAGAKKTSEDEVEMRDISAETLSDLFEDPIEAGLE
jgi:hypothetical protein